MAFLPAWYSIHSIIYDLAQLTCADKIGQFESLVRAIVEVMPETPTQFKLVNILAKIQENSPWNTGFVFVEIFGLCYDYMRIVVAWKLIKFILPIILSFK